MAMHVRKTEHAGAKNAGGYWGTREKAKRESNRVRRANDTAFIDEQAIDMFDESLGEASTDRHVEP